jgi:hypothetical protein
MENSEFVNIPATITDAEFRNEATLKFNAEITENSWAHIVTFRDESLYLSPLFSVADSFDMAANHWKIG